MIKFKIDVLKALSEKGFTTTRLRKEQIISESTIQRIRTAYKNNESLNINLNAVNIICEILKKQPGQLLEWVQDQENSSSAGADQK